MVSMAVGLVISIIQAATQINEATLTFVPKLIVVAARPRDAGPLDGQPARPTSPRYVFEMAAEAGR